MKAVIVRYKVKPGRTEENSDYVRNVYKELAERAPAGLRYATFLAGDGVSFTHIAFVDTPDGANPIIGLPAFKAFQADLKARCDEPPQPVEVTEVGSYRFFG